MTEKTRNEKPKTIKTHLIEMLNLLVQIRKTRISAGIDEYDKVVDKELIAAIKRCETEEQAIFEMSYPLSDPGMLHGYMGVKSYMLNLFFENLFCGRFEQSEIIWLVDSCDEYMNGHKCFNVYNKAYLNALFCEYLQKDIGTLRLSKEDCTAAQKLLSKLDDQKQYELLAETANKISSSELHNYNAKYFERIAPKILAALKKKKLTALLTLED
ncbi:MAG: hypothetical protein IJT91_07555 [Clostridia bacterium]|nr:hypothetical protein [Clostridia bacterium]